MSHRLLVVTAHPENAAHIREAYGLALQVFAPTQVSPMLGAPGPGRCLSFVVASDGDCGPEPEDVDVDRETIRDDFVAYLERTKRDVDGRALVLWVDLVYEPPLVLRSNLSGLQNTPADDDAAPH